MCAQACLYSCTFPSLSRAFLLYPQTDLRHNICDAIGTFMLKFPKLEKEKEIPLITSSTIGLLWPDVFKSTH